MYKNKTSKNRIFFSAFQQEKRRPASSSKVAIVTVRRPHTDLAVSVQFNDLSLRMRQLALYKEQKRENKRDKRICTTTPHNVSTVNEPRQVGRKPVM